VSVKLELNLSVLNKWG